MAKGRGKRSRAAKCGGCANKCSRRVDLAAVREKIIKQVAGCACSMVKTSTDECKKTGNISTMKYLFEAIGLFPCPPGEQGGGDDSELTRTLLRRLGAPEENGGDAEVTNDSGMECVPGGSDAVE